MTGQACRVCGCTDTYGCPERCHWVEPNLCSVCSGATPQIMRHFTRTAAAAAVHLNVDEVPLGMFGIFNPIGSTVAWAWNIADAQLVARGLDVLRTWSGANRVADEVGAIAAEMEVTQPVKHKRWQRGPIARRPNTGIG